MVRPLTLLHVASFQVTDAIAVAVAVILLTLKPTLSISFTVIPYRQPTPGTNPGVKPHSSLPTVRAP